MGNPKGRAGGASLRIQVSQTMPRWCFLAQDPWVPPRCKTNQLWQGMDRFRCGLGVSTTDPMILVLNFSFSKFNDLLSCKFITINDHLQVEPYTILLPILWHCPCIYIYIYLCLCISAHD